MTRPRRSTIEDSYDLVSRDLKRKEHKSEYFLLVARSKPDGGARLGNPNIRRRVIINGVTLAQQSPGVTVSRGARARSHVTGPPYHP